MSCPHRIRPVGAFLCVGGGWHAVEARDLDGAVQLWLVNPNGEARGQDHVLPDHELLGPLPADVVAKVWEL